MVIFMSGNRRHEPIVIVAHVRTTTTTLKGEIKQTFPPFYVPRSACITLHDKIEVQYVGAYVEISRRPSAADGIAWLRDEISAM